MPRAVTMQAIGDWNKQMDVPLANALAASIELTGREGRKAVVAAMVMMAQTARKLTKQSKPNRKIQRDGRTKYFVRDNAEGGSRVFDYWWKGTRNVLNPWVKGNLTFDDARKIKNRGLAKRSWMWGIEDISPSAAISKPIPGVTDLHEFLSSKECGMVLNNRLSYIIKAAPANVEEQAARAAANRVMAMAAKRMEQTYGLTIPRLAASRAKKAAKTLAQAYVEGGA